MEHVKEINKHTAYKQISYYIPENIVEKETQSKILSELIITWAGSYTRAFGHIVSNRTIQDHVLIYCVDGYGWLRLQDRQLKVNPGDVFICPAGMIHNYGADEKDPWTKYWIHFRGSNADEYMKLMGLSISSPMKHIGTNIKIVSWIQEIFNILRKGYTQSNLFYATSYLINIFTYINSESLTANDGVDIEKVISYMLENINSVVGLEQLSEYARISKYHFIRIFKEKTGYTPLDYFMRLKIQKACELLSSPDLKISSVSAELAFSSPYYFSTVFKKITGKSPQNYRQMLY